MMTSKEEFNKENYTNLSGEFFNANFEDSAQIVDIYDSAKQESRIYLKYYHQGDGLFLLVPLRKKIDHLKRNSKLSKTYYSVPSNTKPDAGLDYTKMLVFRDESLFIVNDTNNDEQGEYINFASSQERIIRNNIEEIHLQINWYYEKFKKARSKNRLSRDLLFKFTTLKEFLHLIPE